MKGKALQLQIKCRRENTITKHNITKRRRRKNKTVPPINQHQRFRRQRFNKGKKVTKTSQIFKGLCKKFMKNRNHHPMPLSKYPAFEITFENDFPSFNMQTHFHMHHNRYHHNIFLFNMYVCMFVFFYKIMFFVITFLREMYCNIYFGIMEEGKCTEIFTLVSWKREF